jgi:hypothetical protein
MRGYATGSSLRPDFFILLDRLYEILNHRILEWKLELCHHGVVSYENVWQIIFCSHRMMHGPKDENDRKEKDKVIHDVLLQRLMVAYDLASAFAYMHENK